jgi:hypothetical protein
LRLFGFGVVDGILIGIGWEEVVAVAVDGGANGFAPAVGAKGIDISILGEADGLHQGLDHEGDGAGEFWVLYRQGRPRG